MKNINIEKNTIVMKNKCPDAILTSDWHLRETNPKCRIDKDWFLTMKSKMDFIKIIQAEVLNKHGYEIPILHAGDIFDNWKPSPWLLAFAARFMPELDVIVPGNHDLPAHNINRLEYSGVWVLDSFAYCNLLKNVESNIRLRKWNFVVHGFPYEFDLKSYSGKSEYPKVAIIHKFVYKGRKPFPGATGGCSSIMKKLKGYDLIVSGDNHIPFTHKNKDGQLLVNPGSLFRLTADQINHKPRVYLWYAEENEAEPIYIPIEKGVVSRKHIELEQARNNRLEAFVSSLSSKIELGMDFKKNLKEYCISNKVRKSVRQKIEEAIDA